MNSPFPGMDPYLEAHWLDVHTDLIAETRNRLNQRLPDDLAASSEERVAVESEDQPERHFHPDARIFEVEGGNVATVAEPATGALAPVRLFTQVEPVTERSVRIVEAGTERLITVIEFVSPSNKRDEGLVAFRAKRAQLLNADVNFVEIDLVRAGDWRALLRPHRCPDKYVTTYRATVRIPGDPGAVWLQPIPLRQLLPSIVIPLRKKDPEVRLELQPLIDHAYAGGRYGRRLNYAEPLDEQLTGEDAAWAQSLLAGWKRPGAETR